MCVKGTWSAKLQGGVKEPWLLTVRGKTLVEYVDGVELRRLQVVPPRHGVSTQLDLEVVIIPPESPLKGPTDTPPIGRSEREVTYQAWFGVSGTTYTHVVIVNCDHLKIPIE